MKKINKSLLLSLGLLFASASTATALPNQSELRALDPAMVVSISLDGWAGQLRLESDGDVEADTGQTIGEWFSLPDTEGSGGRILIDLGAQTSIDLSFQDTPRSGDGGLAILTLGGTLSAGSFTFNSVDTGNPCEEPRRERRLCLDTGTEQPSGSNLRIDSVIYVTKCGVFWYEVQLSNGTRTQLHIIVTSHAGQGGKGTTTVGGQVLFVHFKPC